MDDFGDCLEVFMFSTSDHQTILIQSLLPLGRNFFYCEDGQVLVQVA